MVYNIKCLYQSKRAFKLLFYCLCDRRLWLVLFGKETTLPDQSIWALSTNKNGEQTRHSKVLFISHRSVSYICSIFYSMQLEIGLPVWRHAWSFKICARRSFKTGNLVGGWRQNESERKVKKERDGKISFKNMCTHRKEQMNKC